MRILKHLIIIVLVAALSAGAVYAYFSSTARVKGATFSTGTANLLLAPVPEGDHWTSSMTGMNFSGIYPGWTDKYWVFVKNHGSTVLQLNLTAGLDLSPTPPATAGSDPCHLADQIQLGMESWTDNHSESIPEGTINWTHPLSYLGTNAINLGQITPDTLFPYYGNPSNVNFKIYILHFSLPTDFVLPVGYEESGCQLTGYDFTLTGEAQPGIQPTPTTHP
jgi:predicted ribosomally synthesized peptide with SipW-like signal peptide